MAFTSYTSNGYCVGIINHVFRNLAKVVIFSNGKLNPINVNLSPNMPKLAIATCVVILATSEIGFGRSVDAATARQMFASLHATHKTTSMLDRHGNDLPLNSIALAMKKCTIKRYRRPR
jgi:hypothetical protein